MPTSRETTLAALHARLSALPATALRGEVLPERISADGLLILRVDEPGEPEVTLSPRRYHFQHRTEIESVVPGAARFAQQMQGSGGTFHGTSGRDVIFDPLVANTGAMWRQRYQRQCSKKAAAMSNAARPSNTNHQEGAERPVIQLLIKKCFLRVRDVFCA